MLTRRAALAALGATALATRAEAVAEPGRSLRSLAAEKGLLFGAANNNYWLKDSDFATAYLRDCAMLVPEYELKRDLTEPAPGAYDFTASDALLAFAQRHGLTFRGHPLVWFASNPPWLEQAVAAAHDASIFTNYIRVAAGRYRGRMHSWDVVNEAVEPKDGRADGLRDCFWLKKFGPSYIDIAFGAAREADPGALLVYNDYGLESDTPDHDLRRHATLDLLEGMIARGVPVGALGLQGHITAFGPPIHQKKIAAFLDAVRDVGLRILVTEHDVDDSGGPSDFALRDRAVADASRRFLDVALDNPATAALLTWGLSDRFLKPGGLRNTLLRGTPRTLPLDGMMQPTEMHKAIELALAGARLR
ncbi:MAG TPA: endo-1,4-beta-xylanase [Rhizomicrobium sp.]|nr:endo-1,4-beta-xylanase [Rhizomicrobium sp.]